VLVALFAVSYLSGEEGGQLHIWSGYAIAALVVIRVVWGFVGPQHARFADFLFTPARIARYVKNLVAGHPRRFVGHSPAGGVMVVLLLAALAGTTFTGMAQYARETGGGPLAPWYAASVEAPNVVPTARADQAGEVGEYGEAYAGGEGEEAEGGEAFEELHEILANVTLALIVLHVAGVLHASWVHHENLVKAMVTGRKRVDEQPAGGD
jgi:cytochrome b